MRGPQRDRQRGRGHPGDVCDIFEGRRGRIGGLCLSIDTVTLSALRIGELAARSNAGRVRLRAGTTGKRGHRGNESRAGHNRHLHQTAHGDAPFPWTDGVLVWQVSA